MSKGKLTVNEFKFLYSMSAEEQKQHDKRITDHETRVIKDFKQRRIRNRIVHPVLTLFGPALLYAAWWLSGWILADLGS